MGREDSPVPAPPIGGGGGGGGGGAPGRAVGVGAKQMELESWLGKQSLNARTITAQLAEIGVDELDELLTLRPEEVEQLEVSLDEKHKLVSAIGSKLDLSAWLQEWGLSALAAQIDELGVESPEDMLDLLPEEIELLHAKLVEKLQLSKAIAHLDSEHAALAERRSLSAELAAQAGQQKRASDMALMPPPPAPASPDKPPRGGGGASEAARWRATATGGADVFRLAVPDLAVLPSASRSWDGSMDSPKEEYGGAAADGPKTWSGMSSLAGTGGLSAGMFGLTNGAGQQRKSCIGGSRPPSGGRTGGPAGGKPPLGKTIGKARRRPAVGAGSGGTRRTSPPRKGLDLFNRHPADISMLGTVECPF